MKTAAIYVETLAILAAVAVPVHYLGALDWPWAIVAGATAAMLLRAAIHRRPTRPTTGQ